VCGACAAWHVDENDAAMGHLGMFTYDPNSTLAGGECFLNMNGQLLAIHRKRNSAFADFNSIPHVASGSVVATCSQPLTMDPSSTYSAVSGSVVTQPCSIAAKFTKLVQEARGDAAALNTEQKHWLCGGRCNMCYLLEGVQMANVELKFHGMDTTLVGSTNTGVSGNTVYEILGRDGNTQCSVVKPLGRRTPFLLHDGKRRRET
jgi:hypothetical protein